MVRSLGMLDNAFDRWNQQRARKPAAVDRGGGYRRAYAGPSKTFRMFLQSAMLGLAALLVLRQEATGGVMIASSILLGRALAPIDMLIGQWQVVQRGWKGWGTLARDCWARCTVDAAAHRAAAAEGASGDPATDRGAAGADAGQRCG